MSADTRSIIYFVRHGEDKGNITRTHLPPDESPLTETGQTQARLLGEHLKNEKFTRAFASSYLRAFQTGEIILSESNFKTDLVDEPRLVEWGIGYLGKSVKEILTDFANADVDFVDWKPEGGETREQITERIDSFLQDIFDLVDKTSEPQKILAVSHGAFYLHLWKILQADSCLELVGWKPEMYAVMRNTGYFKLAIQKLPPDSKETKRQLEILQAHGNEHLKPLATPDTLAKYAQEEETMKSFKGCVQQ